MDSELEKIEAELGRLSPECMPEGLIRRMEAAMEGWQDLPEENSRNLDKVVPFRPRQDEPEERSKTSRSSLWAAAASVALLGGVAAMVFTASPDARNVATGKENGDGGKQATTSVVNPSAVFPIEMAPTTAKRKIVDASERDVIIPNGARPMRLRRVNLVDRVVFLSPGGQEVHVEVPSVNYQLVPVPTD